ncbi:MAG: LLM class flavin-dependent oxidoreductase [Candidatus Rokubacteria bacterium]|nr:LLM class flavin-dependent oxidoreductase [Candidatus Rokubacteria bacterium]
MSTPRINVGVLLPTREAVMSGRPEAAPLLEMAERAEAAGYDSVWVGDSLLARPRFEPLTLLAATAARTRRVTLGTAVLLPALRHPLLLAHAVASVDRIAEGRLVLGVGIAPDTPGVRKEFEAAGVPFRERVGRLVETMALCRRLWAPEAAGGPVSFEGRYWKLAGAQILPAPARAGGPPIWMGGEVEGALRRAGRSADGWFPNSRAPQVYRDGWATVLREAGQSGRPASAIASALYTTINIGPDTKAAEAEMRSFIEGYYGAPYEVIAARWGHYAGSPEGCLEWLGAFREAGARHIVLRFASADQAAQMERATRFLLPRLRG